MDRISPRALVAFFKTLPEQFEANGYDYARFRRLFLMGTLIIWGLILSIYLIFDENHTFRGALVAILAALIFMLVWFPLSVANSNRADKRAGEDNL